MSKNRDPIVLTGKVYVASYLAAYYPGYKLPAELLRGDIKIDCHLDENGRANRASNTKKGRLRGYSGYFTGLLFDGESWRKFSIAAIAGNSAKYCNQASKADKIHSVVSRLRAKAGRMAICGEGSYLLLSEFESAANNGELAT